MRVCSCVLVCPVNLIKANREKWINSGRANTVAIQRGKGEGQSGDGLASVVETTRSERGEGRGGAGGGGGAMTVGMRGERESEKWAGAEEKGENGRGAMS